MPASWVATWSGLANPIRRETAVGATVVDRACQLDGDVLRVRTLVLREVLMVDEFEPDV
jgi:hypothetical protein